MYTHLAYYNNQVYRANNFGSIFGYSGSIAQTFTPNIAMYANFNWNAQNIAFQRTNFNQGTFLGLNNNILKFNQPNGFSSGRVNFSVGRDVERFYRDLGNHLSVNKITGIMEIFEEPLNEAFEKKDKKSFEEIVNLILNYGAKAVEIAKGLGIIKSENEESGWIPVEGLDVGDGTGTGYGTGPGKGDPVQKKDIPDPEKDKTILGIPQNTVIGGLGLAAIGYAVFKK